MRTKKIMSIGFLNGVVALFAVLALGVNLISMQVYALSDEEKQIEETVYVSPIAGNVAQVELGYEHVAVLRTDGTVAASGDNAYGQCNVSQWKNVVKILASENVTIGMCKDGTILSTNADLSSLNGCTHLVINGNAYVGIREDGTVAAEGEDYWGNKISQENGYNFSSWKNIKDVVFDGDYMIGLDNSGCAVLTGPGSHMRSVSHWRNIQELYYFYARSTVLGISKDGRVYSDGSNDYFDVSGWRNITKIGEGYLYTLYGISSSGTVKQAGEISVQTDGISGLTDLALGIRTGIGLKKDGSVTLFPDEKTFLEYNKFEISEWRDITKLYHQKGNLNVIGLRKDGSVVAISLDSIEHGANGWTNIVDLWTNGWLTIGLKKDGTLISTYDDFDVDNLTEGVVDTRPVVDNVDTFSAGAYHSVWVRPDGTVATAGKMDSNRCDVTNWRDIVAVAAYEHTVGLKADGTVVAVGPGGNGECNVSTWTDIVDISAGSDNTVGLTASGKVVVTGSNKYKQCNVSEWFDIVDIAAGDRNVYALSSGGYVYAAGSNAYAQKSVSSWSNVVQISVGSTHVVGLQADGTVVAAGSNGYGQCDVQDWTDIIAVSAGTTHTIGLKADGTVVSAGDNRQGQCNVGAWADIVAVSAGMSFTVGQKADGTLVAIGSNAYEQCNVSN